ncbi:MAG TPA: glycosyltransferase [Candidatus Dormibacteraeota bacterium]|jgi:cellulose synthase/poly-beta-1,6-N-acetylglucosamine synthase-like glycosyltransferase|nr:glycosyltransferase [Candidatus Dormibacteraeota bacterium]
MLFELTLFFAFASLAATLVAILPGAPAWRFWASFPACALVLSAAGLAVAVVSDDRAAGVALPCVAFVLTLVMRALQPRWGLVACQLFTSFALAAVCYLAYATAWTVTAGYGIAVWVGSILLLLLEIGALALGVSYAFEILDVLGRREPRVRPLPTPTRYPWVALQVPTYNEPVDVVRPTLESLSRLDYPNLIIQVVDNNTSDPAVWQPLQRLCEELGPRFHFLHLDPWPGYKAGACNEATRRLPEEVEIVGIVDADYSVREGWLQALIGHFDDPSVAFVQSSQHYRDWEDSAYLRGLFYSYRYFFDVTMPARDHRNAIIFCGTMGLIRRSALEEIGGWNEDCITEDAEASLRMLGHGHRGVYDARAWGTGLMPLDFDGLKKQRYRWALGGLQILRFHWRELLPFAPHRLRLTRGQRIHYLLGSVQWFGDLLTATFTVLLLATALATALHHRLPLRQLTGAVLAVPVVFLVTGVGRALWAMRRTTGCSWRDSVHALRCWFAMSWVVTLACVRGLFTSKAVFLRTPKRRTGEGSLRRALFSSRAETLLAGSALVATTAMIVVAPSGTTVALGTLLLFQGWLYTSAPWASMAAEGITMTPARRAYLQSPQNTGERPALRPTTVGVAAGGIALAAAAVVAYLVATGPSSSQAPFTRGPSDLPRIGAIAPAQSASPSPSSSPTASPSASAPGQSSTSSSSTTSSSSSSTSSSSTASSPPPSAAPSGTP